nr:uncharacterized protein LOC109781460 [Aegilops tauschii subsp. strangulata]XP_040251391.1 uncharacterized protein LOC120968567 [Aegilops tauschii subsp. strangulata]
MLDSGDLRSASRDKGVSVLAALVSSEARRARTHLHEEVERAPPRAPHSGSLAPTPCSGPLPLQHLAAGRIRDGLVLLLLAVLAVAWTGAEKLHRGSRWMMVLVPFS